MSSRGGDFVVKKLKSYRERHPRKLREIPKIEARLQNLEKNGCKSAQQGNEHTAK
jgi:hypothetical protein